jgi:hypothetical protein
MARKAFFLTPGYRPVGGVIKLFDYVGHANDLGYEVVVCAPVPVERDMPLFRVPGLECLAPGGSVSYRADFRPRPALDDIVFFSWPRHWSAINKRLPPGFSYERVIMIVQNVRHANPRWLGGEGLELLSRPMTRIAINTQVLSAIDPYLNRSCETRLIPLGHRADYFACERREDVELPLRVAYTTWKSSVGDRVRDLLAGDERFSFSAIRHTADWQELRALYHGCDVFLGCPGPEEGFYLVGLEAMSAGALLVLPDVGGNRAYCRFGENCLSVPFEDAEAYAERLRELAAAPRQQLAALRAAGYAEIDRHLLTQERGPFADLLGRLDEAPSPGAPRVAGGVRAAVRSWVTPDLGSPLRAALGRPRGKGLRVSRGVRAAMTTWRRASAHRP